jgi:hypothetical protein
MCIIKITRFYINPSRTRRLTRERMDSYPELQVIGTTNNSVSGYMDDIRIYNTSLSQTEILLYNYDGLNEIYNWINIWNI